MRSQTPDSTGRQRCRSANAGIDPGREARRATLSRTPLADGRPRSESAAGGNTSGTTEVATTFAPEARMRHMSSIASEGRRSPVASVRDAVGARVRGAASTSFVALTPGRRAGRRSSPASPTFFVRAVTQSPTSSRSGWLMMPRRAELPDVPGAPLARRDSSLGIPLGVLRVIRVRSPSLTGQFDATVPPSTSKTLPVIQLAGRRRPR